MTTRPPNPEPTRRAPGDTPSPDTAERRAPGSPDQPDSIESPPPTDPDGTPGDPDLDPEAHVGATEEQIGDRTGPGAGYDQGNKRR